MKKRYPPEVSAPELQSGLGYFRGLSHRKYTTNLSFAALARVKVRETEIGREKSWIITREDKTGRVQLHSISDGLHIALKRDNPQKYPYPNYSQD